MKDLTVNLPGREYKIYIGGGILGKAGELLKTVTEKPCKAALITDCNVWRLYGMKVKNSLESSGYEVCPIVIEAGEDKKNIATLEYIYGELADFSITRSDIVVALGGGVVGDMAGFAASTILRGVRVAQIPTTLLAQVDSSVGGKTAINLKNGKNLVGTIYQPSIVIADNECIYTLDNREFSCGMAEIIKYGLIRDAGLFTILENAGGRKELEAPLTDIIYTCCDIKRELVLADEFDTGERMLLNFGHTLGHAYEKAYDYKRYSHGEAVAAGMAAATRAGMALGLTDRSILGKIENILIKYGLPEKIAIGNKSEYRKALTLDKKSSGADLRIVLIRNIGEAFIHSIKKDEFLKLIERENI